MNFRYNQFVKKIDLESNTVLLSERVVTLPELFENDKRLEKYTKTQLGEHHQNQLYKTGIDNKYQASWNNMMEQEPSIQHQLNAHKLQNISIEKEVPQETRHSTCQDQYDNEYQFRQQYHSQTVKQMIPRLSIQQISQNFNSYAHKHSQDSFTKIKKVQSVRKI